MSSRKRVPKKDQTKICNGEKGPKSTLTLTSRLGQNCDLVTGGVLDKTFIIITLPGSPNPVPILDQKNVIFHTRFQTWGSSSKVPIINRPRVSVVLHLT